MRKDFSKQFFEIHSDIRLPFEPKGEALALKEEIRRNVKLLNPREYNHLNARLITNDREFFDVENILFYNVGAGAFSHLRLDEVSFSLVCDSYSRSNKYTYSYELLSEAANEEIYSVILEFSFEMDKMTSNMKPLDYWHAINQGDFMISRLMNPNEFGLSIVIEIPEKHHNITSVFKPMIDGLISAFHYQNSVNQDVLNHIAERKHISEGAALSQLSQKDHTFLGERCLISSYRNGIKWNPEDEKCTKINIRQIKGLNNSIKVYGKAFSI